MLKTEKELISRMNQELDKLSEDNQLMHQQILECQRKLQSMEMNIGFEFSSDPMEIYRSKPGHV